MDAPTTHEQNADQVAYWNGPAGQRWADRQAAQDVLLKPVADLVVDRAGFKPGERVIDVACGSGATTIAFARKVAPSGHVLGVDVSGPMLERARQAAPKDLPIDFVLADATVYPFEPASFDVLATRAHSPGPRRAYNGCDAGRFFCGLTSAAHGARGCAAARA